MTSPSVIKRRYGFSVMLVLAMGVLAVSATLAYGHSSGGAYTYPSSGYDYPGGTYPDHPPEGDYPYPPPSSDYPEPPDEGEPPGGDHGGPPCVDKPPGVTKAETHAIFVELKKQFEHFDHSGGPPDAATIERLVREAAVRAGVNNEAAIQFVIDVILAHMPGNHARGDGSGCEGQPPPVGVPGDGVPDDGFDHGFLKRIHRVKMEVDQLDGRVLYGTILRFVRLPAVFADQDDDLVEVEAAVKFRPKARVFRDHKRVAFDELGDADRVLVKAKVMKPEDWLTDPEGDTVPSLVGFRAYILE